MISSCTKMASGKRTRICMRFAATTWHRPLKPARHNQKCRSNCVSGGCWSSSIQSSRKQAALGAVDKFVDQKMRPEDQAMVVSWRLGLHIISPFTSDKAAVRRAVDTLRHIAPAGESQQNAVSTTKRDIQWQFRLAEDNLISWADAYANAQSLSDRYAQRLTVEQEPMLAALERMS